MTEKRTTGAIERIAVTHATHSALRSFSFALGLTQDQAIDWLLKQAAKPGETPYDAGTRLYEAWRQKLHTETIEAQS